MDYDPLIAAPPPEVPLPEAPLVRVIAQVRFTPILSVEKREFIAPFQEVIRGTYPILRQEQTRGLMLGPQGVAPLQGQVVWRFSDVERAWRVSLATDFLALETTSYSSRSDFLARLKVVVEAVQEHIKPNVVQRQGLRYIDRVTGQTLEEIDGLVRPEVLGIAGTALASQARLTISETIFDLPNSKAQLLARWGRVPEGTTVDPAAIEPIDEPSWVLDVDMYSSEQRPFASDQVLADAGGFAERLYTFFRWAVTDEFLRRFGGQP